MATKSQSISNLEDLETIIDTDVHPSPDIKEDILPYLPSPFDKLLDGGGKIKSKDLLPSSGFLHPRNYGTVDQAELNNPEDARNALEMFNADRQVLTPLVSLGMIHHEELGVAIAQAYNDWMLDTLLDEVEGSYGAALVAPLNPKAAAEEIDRRKNESKIVGVMIPGGGLSPPLGREKYFPIYEAAEKAGLPILIHNGVSGLIGNFPMQYRGTKRLIDAHVTVHPSQMMFHLSTMLTNGVPVRYPNVNFVLQESGLGWIPFFMHRYNNEYSEKRQDAPMLDKQPSEYIENQFYFSSQPIEGADNQKYISEVIRQIKGGERLMFSSDYPHYDFDYTDQLLKILRPEFDDESIRNIYGETALNLFDF